MKKKMNICCDFNFNKTRLILLSFLFATLLSAQNENAKWYFGTGGGLDFLSNPPSVLSNGSTVQSEAYSTISDSNGALLFYSTADTIWNKNHLVMANGAGLFGNKSSTQGVLIAKQPNSGSIYYVFTTDAFGTSGGGNQYGLRYSIVDMSLAAGLGSVTTKNALLHAPAAEKLAGTVHCNGQDLWIVSHELNNSNFRSYLLSSAGINTTPVVSSIGAFHAGSNDFCGQLKFSPNGKKIGLALINLNIFQVFDFDNTTGFITNPLTFTVVNSTGMYGMYSCEFSPDGTKFYGGRWTSPYRIFQWDLCSGSNYDIINSEFTVYTTTGFDRLLQMQLANDGKIYVAHQYQGGGSPYMTLGTIVNPNGVGSACNYIHNSVSISPAKTSMGLPNLIKNQPMFSPFSFSTQTTSCKTVSFTFPPSININTLTGCEGLGLALSTFTWNFGDPLSGAANTSTLVNPTHNYSNLGVYIPTLMVTFSCGPTQNITKTVLLQQPILTSSNATICINNFTTLSVFGASSYTWNNTTQNNSIVVSPSVTSEYTVVGTSLSSSCSSTKVVTVTVSPCLGINETKPSKINDLEISPNPVLEIISFSFTGQTSPASLSIIVFDAFGKEIHREIGTNSIGTIDCRTYKPGYYCLFVSDGILYRRKMFIKIE